MGLYTHSLSVCVYICVCIVCSAYDEGSVSSYMRFGLAGRGEKIEQSSVSAFVCPPTQTGLLLRGQASFLLDHI